MFVSQESSCATQIKPEYAGAGHSSARLCILALSPGHHSPYINPKALGLLDSRLFLRNESGVQESSALDRGFFSSAAIVTRHWHSTLYPHGVRTFPGFVPFRCLSSYAVCTFMGQETPTSARPLASSCATVDRVGDLIGGESARRICLAFLLIDRLL